MCAGPPVSVGRWGRGFILLSFLLLSAGSVAASEPLQPEMIEAWSLVGDHGRALDEARHLLEQESVSWRDHAAYIEAASASHLRWAVVDEYRWLASREQPDGPMALLAAWSVVLQARGPALDRALVELEAHALHQGLVGTLLLAEGLLEAGRFERVVSLVDGADTPQALALHVQALVGLGEYRQAALLARQALEAHPERPDLATSLWSRGVEDRHVRRARRLAVKAARELLHRDDPVALYRAWLLLAWAKDRDGAGVAAERIGQAVPGLELPDRLPYGPTMIEHLGESLARTGRDEPVGTFTPAELGAVAIVRARTLREDGLVDPARRAYREAIDLAGDDPQLLLEAAALHLDVEPRRSLEWVGQALLLLACQPGLDPALRRGAIARALELQASALRSLEHHDQALSYQLVASLLRPTPEGLVQLAALQEQQGSVESALESLAIAAAMGSKSARTEMQRLYRGPATVDALIRAVESELETWLAAPAVPPASAQPRALPSHVLSTTAGDMSFDDLRGEVVVLVFWASWCAPCAEELPMLAELHREWAEDGLPVQVIGVSVDSEEEDFRRGLRRFDELGIHLAWEPHLATELDVEAVPATRLFDPEGLAAGRVQGFQPGHRQHLDAMVRALLEP